MKDGTAITIRPIRPEDEPLMVRLHEALSESSVHLRYFHAMKLSSRVAHERLTRICFIDYDREMALVADRWDPDAGRNEILAVGRLSILRGRQRPSSPSWSATRIRASGWAGAPEPADRDRAR
jgi:acetyltransferase